MRLILTIVCLTSLILTTSSCLPAVVGVSAWQYSKGRTHDRYREYVSDREELNAKRRDMGQEPLEIKTFEEWKQTK